MSHNQPMLPMNISNKQIMFVWLSNKYTLSMNDIIHEWPETAVALFIRRKLSSSKTVASFLIDAFATHKHIGSGESVSRVNVLVRRHQGMYKDSGQVDMDTPMCTCLLLLT